ncbi:MAG: NirD/YgiW/YdeI family stress tolerance protein [Burkholderiales bacterium]|nr:NirD/YgiW/YdeI family stress tolerance protein [Burkholderiales bacterium]
MPLPAMLLAFLLLPALVIGTAQAQYTGPGAAPVPGSVAEVLKNPVDDRKVLLRGKLLKQVSGDKYLFSDGTGEIRVEIDDNLLRGIRISETSVIEIYGEIEKNFMRAPEIDVERIRVIEP